MPRFVPVIFLLLFAVAATPVSGKDVPQLRSHVNDMADLISPELELKLESFLTDFERSDSTQIVVLTVPSLEGEALGDYSLKVAEKAGIGQEGKDNGALLLVAKDERKVRIEVGYGLEGRLTDLLSGRIIDNEITPRFKQGDFDGGILAGVASMAEAVRGEYQGTGRASRKEEERSPWGALAMLLFFGPGMLFFGGGRRSRYHRRRSHGVWLGGGGFRGGGGMSGGFGGGGGGFGGGGASGGW